jgi:hypothetical protein
VNGTLSAGVKSYTVGAGGAINTLRPQRIERANLLISSDDREPLEVLDYEQWADVDHQDEQGVPSAVYLDRGATAGRSTLFVHKAPDKTYTIELYVWQPFARFASKDDNVELPPEYEEAIVYNLAVRLAAIAGTTRLMDPEVREIARTSLADIQSLNAPCPTMACDAAIVQAGRLFVRGV